MVMFRRGRRRRSMSMTPIHSVKNQKATKQSIMANVNVIDILASAVEVGTATKVFGNEVPVGAKIFSIDVSVNFISSSGSITGNFDWCLVKTRTGQTATSIITSPDWSDIG